MISSRLQLETATTTTLQLREREVTTVATLMHDPPLPNQHKDEEDDNRLLLPACHCCWLFQVEVEEEIKS